MNNETIDILCLNCGNKFKTNINRFPICNCGVTIPATNQTLYGKCLFNGTELSGIELIRGNEYAIYPPDDYENVIKKIADIPFDNSENAITLLLSDMPLHRSVLIQNDYTIAEMVLHIYYFSHSDVYNTLFNMDKIREAKTLLHSSDIRNFRSTSQYNYFKEHISEYTDLQKDEDLIIAIDCCLEMFHKTLTDALIKSKISVAEFKKLYEGNNLNLSDILKDLSDLRRIEVFSDDAVKYLTEYDFYRSELEKYFGHCNVPENVPFYLQYFIAKIEYQMYQNNGLLAYRKYVDKYNDNFSTYNIDGLEIQMINGIGMSEFPIGSLPTKEVTAPVIGVFKNGNLISMIANCQGQIFINGDQSDHVKKAVNKFLDIIENI